jgi:hypothetical protein
MHEQDWCAVAWAAVGIHNGNPIVSQELRHRLDPV